VVDEQQVGAPLAGGLEQVEVRRDTARQPRDLAGAGDLEPVRPVILEAADLEQLVAEADDLVSPRHDYDSDVTSPETAPGRSDFLESLMETELYTMGAYFSDEHPELVDEVIARSAAIEDRGIESYAEAHEASVEETFETLLTGLAVRYYKAVAG